jgi:hypothetical protein
VLVGGCPLSTQSRDEHGALEAAYLVLVSEGGSDRAHRSQLQKLLILGDTANQILIPFSHLDMRPPRFHTVGMQCCGPLL